MNPVLYLGHYGRFLPQKTVGSHWAAAVISYRISSTNHHKGKFLADFLCRGERSRQTLVVLMMNNKHWCGNLGKIKVFQV